MPVHLVPAGVEAYSNNAQLGITNQGNSTERSYFGKMYKKWKTHDKVLTEIASGKKVTLPEETFDQLLPIFSPTFVKLCGFEIILANPVVGKEFYKEPYERFGIKSIVDSGGFQLLKDSVTFVNPDDVIERYNANANIGMPLDLPMESKYEAAYFDAASKLIRANDRYILSKLEPVVDLALISHGTTLALREARLNVLDRRAKVIAIAGLHIQPQPGVDRLEAAIENFMYVISRYRKTTEYFHVLGVTSRTWMFIYALLSESGYVKNIGADSVSHRLASLVGDFDTLDFRTIPLTKNPPYNIRPMCSCPVCSLIQDTRILQSWRILESHNLWVRKKQVETIVEIAQAYKAGLMSLSEVHKAARLTLPYEKFTKVVRYVEEVVSNKFRPFRVKRTTSALFKRPKSHLVTNDRYDKIFQRYEKFHKERFTKKH